MFYYKMYQSPFGRLTIVCDETRLLELVPETQERTVQEKPDAVRAGNNKCGVAWPDGRLSKAVNGEAASALSGTGKAGRGKTADRDGEPPVLEQAATWLDRYFAGEKPDPCRLPLAPQGSRFRQMVWQELLKIPYGKTTTYGEIGRIVAKRLHKEKMSAQAVGGAVGHNPIPVIIPCHRVVGSSGSLTGYAGGLDMKWNLLRHEKADTDRLFMPKGKAAVTR